MTRNDITEDHHVALHSVELCAGVGMLGEGVRAMKPIPGYEGRYSAEEDGRIYSHVSNKHLRQAPSGEMRAYRHVVLVNANGRRRSHNVHTLILLAFKGPRPCGCEARHLDGKGSNNSVGNLEWSTHSENLLDKHAHGTMPKGERHPAASISDTQVAELHKRRKEGLSYPALGRLFGISTSQAHRICTGQNRGERACG